MLPGALPASVSSHLCNSGIYSRQGLAFQSERSGERGPQPSKYTFILYIHTFIHSYIHTYAGILPMVSLIGYCAACGVRWDYNLPGNEEEEKKTYLDPAEALTRRSVFALCFCSPCSQHTNSRQTAKQQISDSMIYY